MTQFRPGQRVRVVDEQSILNGHEGSVWSIDSNGMVAVDVSAGVYWLPARCLQAVIAPGIPAHLHRAPTTDAARHLPIWGP